MVLSAFAKILLFASILLREMGTALPINVTRVSCRKSQCVLDFDGEVFEDFVYEQLSQILPQPGNSTLGLVQINNDVLNALIDNRIKKVLGQRPVLQMLTISRASSSLVQLLARNGTVLDQIFLSNPSVSVTGSNNIIGYRPNYSDWHSSGMAGLFFNLEAIFPCSSKCPRCHLFTAEKDGFANGIDIIQAGDSGNNFQIFSSSGTCTYEMAVRGCAQLSGTASCLPVAYQISLVCILDNDNGECSDVMSNTDAA